MEELILELQAQAKLNSTQEICGVIGSDMQIYPIRNVAKVSASCFIFDKRQYFLLMNTFKEYNIKVAYVYHSHPNGDPTPSRADIDYTKRSGVPQIIITKNTYKVVTRA